MKSPFAKIQRFPVFRAEKSHFSTERSSNIGLKNIGVNFALPVFSLSEILNFTHMLSADIFYEDICHISCMDNWIFDESDTNFAVLPQLVQILVKYDNSCVV